MRLRLDKSFIPKGILALTALFFVINFFARSTFLSSYFIADWSDTFMDHFNMLVNIQMGDPYYRYSNYPAICFLIFKLFFHFIPRGSLIYLDDKREIALYLRSLMPGILPLLISYMVCMTVIAISVQRIMKDSSATCKQWCIPGVIFSGPFLFLLERGNILLISFAALLLFFALKDSQSCRVRLFADLCFALAIALKLYPAAFLLILLREHKFKEVLNVVILAGILLLLPFLMFGGINSVLRMFAGWQIVSEAAFNLGYNYSLSNFAKILSLLTCGKVPNCDIWGMLIGGGLCLGAVPFLWKDWELITVLGIMCIWVPNPSYTYTLIMLIPGLLKFIDSEAAQGLDKRTFLISGCFILALSPIISLPISSAQLLPGSPPLYWGTVFTNVIILITFCLIVIPNVRRKLNAR